jgi:predicted dienelactone hydrolase
MAGATNYAFSVANAQPAQSGYYSVIVSNASGSVTSQVAELKVFLSLPTPHSLSGIQAVSNGSVSLSFKGETTLPFAPYYALYPVETSSNLVDWAPLITLQRTNTALDLLSFSDTNAPLFNWRFYRTPTNQLATPLPQSTGPYPVGTFSMLLTNTYRNNAKFMVSFWYPAVAQAGVLPAAYVEKQVAQVWDDPQYAPRTWASQVAAFVSHSLSNAPLATNLAEYPVLLYDPAFGGDRRENTDKAEDLASWGYVVVGLDHRDAFCSVYPNGTVVYGQTIDTSSITAIDAFIEERLLDVRFVLDELGHLNANDPRLGGRLDLDKIGAFGWSLGGAITAQMCLRDPRCKAGAGFDSPFYETNLLTQTMGVPYLLFIAERSLSTDGVTVFNHMVTNAYWVKLRSTVHGNFGEFDLVVDSAALAAVWGTPPSGQFLPQGRASEIVRAYLLSFFNKYLRGEDDHLLDGPSPAYPEVMQFLKH